MTNSNNNPSNNNRRAPLIERFPQTFDEWAKLREHYLFLLQEEQKTPNVSYNQRESKAVADYMQKLINEVAKQADLQPSRVWTAFAARYEREQKAAATPKGRTIASRYRNDFLNWRDAQDAAYAAQMDDTVGMGAVARIAATSKRSAEIVAEIEKRLCAKLNIDAETLRADFMQAKQAASAEHDALYKKQREAQMAYSESWRRVQTLEKQLAEAKADLALKLPPREKAEKKLQDFYARQRPRPKRIKAAQPAKAAKLA